MTSSSPDTPVAQFPGSTVYQGPSPQLRPEDSWQLKLQHLLTSPARTLTALGALALSIEVAQSWPEAFDGAHALGEFVRNLAYALIGALLFNWILVEIPAQRRRRTAYAYHELALKTLVTLGPGLLGLYRGVAKTIGSPETDPDAWDRVSVQRCAHEIWSRRPDYFGQERRAFLTHGIMGVQESLDGMSTAAYFFDADVAHALSLFPGQRGLNQLQPPPPGFPEPWKRDAHIVWELVTAAQRLYGALRNCAPYLDLKVEEAQSILGDGTVIPFRASDLIPPKTQ